MGRLAGIVVAAVAAASSPAAAQAAVDFRPCVRGSDIECATVPVPLDRAGAVPGTVKLHVERFASLGRREGALITLAGGPGEAATPYLPDWAGTFLSALRNRDLIVFDQRGTGLSGALRCRRIQVPVTRTPLKQAEVAAACAQSIGAARAFYTTRDSVEDVEAIRTAIGVERVALFGVSYGTKVALAYAARYPHRVERLVVDSVVEPTGPGAFSQESIAAVPRVLQTLCARSACADITPDPIADVAALVRRMRTGGFVYGPLVSARGKRHRARIGSVRLLDLLFAGDFDPTLRAYLPGAVRAALTGDSAPLLRLALQADRGSGRIEPVESFSNALYAATVCEEGPFPWARATPAAARVPAAEAALRQVPATALHPFDRTTALFASPVVQLCNRWPTAVAEPAIADGPFPQVPTLVLAGEDDLRTPLESARRIAGRIPGAALISVPEMGHSVLNGFPRSCGVRAADDFFAGRPLRRCPPRRRDFPPRPAPPRRLSEVEPVALGGRPGRTLSAVALTLVDSLDQVFSAALLASADQNVLHVGGLRAGYARAGRRTLELHGIQYVPGVRVSGTLRIGRDVTGVLRVSGRAASRGRLVFRRNGSVGGRLGGRRVRVPGAVTLAGGNRPLGAAAASLARLRQMLDGAPRARPGSRPPMASPE